jgi:Domain of unknown function (DUF4336)
MLHNIAPGIWHAQHYFLSAGMRISTRMTVVRLKNSALWIHSPIPLSPELRAELIALGSVHFIVAPNKMHHLFAAQFVHAFPQARLYGAPGLSAKRPDLKNMIELKATVEPEWQDDFEQLFFGGIPAGNEIDWYHKATRTLILTDICQWLHGDMALPLKLYARLAGVRKQLGVALPIRLMVKDKQAARDSARAILAWPFERVVVAHNVIIEKGAHAAVEAAFKCFA